MLPAGEQIAQLGHGIAEVADPRFDRDREAGVTRADVVAPATLMMKSRPIREMVNDSADVAVLGEVVGGADRRDHFVLIW